MTRHQIALLAGVNRTQIRHLMVGQSGRPPARGLRPETARALLAVRPGASQPAEGATCDATGTRRRLRALMANGWPAQTLAAKLLGLDNDTGRSALLQVARRERVRSVTALAVRALYDELADHPGPSAWCRTFYRGHGWLPPLWWDDDTIDDPAFDYEVSGAVDDIQIVGGFPKHTSPANVDVDQVAIDRVLAGERGVTLNRAEKTAALEQLLNKGYSLSAAGERLGMSGQTARRYELALIRADRSVAVGGHDARMVEAS